MNDGVSFKPSSDNTRKHTLFVGLGSSDSEYFLIYKATVDMESVIHFLVPSYETELCKFTPPHGNNVEIWGYLYCFPLAIIFLTINLRSLRLEITAIVF